MSEKTTPILDWIKDLVLEEQEKEQKGLVDLSFNPQKAISIEKSTVQFLRQLRLSFADAANAYNALRRDNPNQIKVYGVSNTLSDFMLFRNNTQLIFSMIQPGVIQIYSSQLQSSPSNGLRSPQQTQELVNTLKAKMGPFDIVWTYDGQAFKSESLVKFYFSMFIHLSANH